ncbi:MAG: peptidoglycan-binding protein [Candidatus Methylomirabilales bacterium]
MKRKVVIASAAAGGLMLLGSVALALEIYSSTRMLDLETTREIEARLQAAGFNPGPVDGMISAETREAIRRFQRQRGLPANGMLDAETLSALLPTAPPPQPAP